MLNKTIEKIVLLLRKKIIFFSISIWIDFVLTFAQGYISNSYSCCVVVQCCSSHNNICFIMAHRKRRGAVSSSATQTIKFMLASKLVRAIMNLANKNSNVRCKIDLGSKLVVISSSKVWNNYMMMIRLSRIDLCPMTIKCYINKLRSVYATN